MQFPLKEKYKDNIATNTKKSKQTTKPQTFNTTI